VFYQSELSRVDSHERRYSERFILEEYYTSLPPPPRPHRSTSAHTAPPHSHLYFGYKLPVRFAHLGLSQPSVRTELPSTSIQPTPLTPANTQPLHTLARYTKEPWLYPPPALTKERSSVGRAQAPHRLASRWCPFDPLFKRSRLHCRDICLTWHLWHIKLWWQYLHRHCGHHPGTLPFPTCCVYLLCLFC